MGELAEWIKAPVSKTGGGSERVTRGFKSYTLRQCSMPSGVGESKQ